MANHNLTENSPSTTISEESGTASIARQVRQPRRTVSQKSDAHASLGDTRIRQLSHSAVRVRDMEKTRQFYEDVLELPMTTSLLADFDAGTGEASDYIHCFFQMADGSAIAFFQFGEGFRTEVPSPQGDAYDRHLALRVDDAAMVSYFKQKADEYCREGLGAMALPPMIIDHDDFLSLYLTDPDGNFIEVTWHKPSLEELIDPHIAHNVLKDWLEKQRAIRNRAKR